MKKKRESENYDKNKKINQQMLPVFDLTPLALQLKLTFIDPTITL